DLIYGDGCAYGDSNARTGARNGNRNGASNRICNDGAGGGDVELRSRGLPYDVRNAVVVVLEAPLAGRNCLHGQIAREADTIAAERRLQRRRSRARIERGND